MKLRQIVVLLMAVILVVVALFSNSAQQKTAVTSRPTPIPTALAVAQTPPAAPQPSPTSPQPSATPLPAGTPVPAGQVASMKSPETGVQLFLWGSASVDRDLKLAKDAGFGWIKQMFQWNYIEKQGKGMFEWNEPDRLVKAANGAGLKIVARVDYTPDWAKPVVSNPLVQTPPSKLSDFGDFIYALVSRYKEGSPNGQIHAYEIWNEPNLAREWAGNEPNAAQYVEMLKVAYQAAKRADPKAVVVTAGLSPTGTNSAEAKPDDVFLAEMYKAGARDYFDVLGAHAAGFKAPPEMSPDEIAANKEYGGQRFFGFRRVEDLRAVMVKNGDEKKQVMILEMGWTTDNRPGSPYAWHAVTEQQKGEYIVRAYQFAQKNWAPWIGMMSTVYVSAPYWTDKDEQYYWALTDPDGKPRASYNYIKGKLP